MKIEIKLDDPKRCRGCPCLNRSGNYIWYVCGWGYDLRPVKYGDDRPQECIDKHGE